MAVTGQGMISKALKMKMAKEVEQEFAPCEDSPSKRKKAPSEKSPAVNSDALKAVLTDENKEVNMLISKFIQVMSAHIVEDAAVVYELEDILKEARALEAHLRQKKEGLRLSLAAFSNKLQG